MIDTNVPEDEVGIESQVHSTLPYFPQGHLSERIDFFCKCMNFCKCIQLNIVFKLNTILLNTLKNKFILQS